MHNQTIPIDQIIIPNDHLINVCKYRQQGCCKFIIFLEKAGEFCCAKNVKELRQNIDSAADMNAVNDNCKGIPCDEIDQ